MSSLRLLAIAAVFAVSIGEPIGLPFGTDLPPFEALKYRDVSPLWGAFAKSQKSFPTNSWWENAILESGSSSFDTLPYMVAVVENGLSGCYPRRVVTETSVINIFWQDIYLLAVEDISLKTYLAEQSELGVTVTKTNRGVSGGASSLSFPLVRGMPYLTAIYENATPNISSANVLVSVNGSSIQSVQKGSTFTLSFEGQGASFGLNQTWMVFFSREIEVSWSSNGLVATQPLDAGWVRVAVLPDPDRATADSSLLSRHSTVIPTGGNISLVDETKQTGVVLFEWTLHPASRKTAELLLLSLPHHRQLLLQNDDMREDVSSSPDYRLLSMKGNMTQILGSSWRLRYSIPPITWTSPCGVSDHKQKIEILNSLRVDVNSTFQAPDSYGTGKELGRMGRIALIAEELGNMEIVRVAVTKIKTHIEPWLNGSHPDALVYDSSYGGVVSRLGLNDSAADYGNGIYNDHHFHWGYFLYASAVIAKFDPEWASRWGHHVRALLRDIANPSYADPYFTVHRHLDWYAGHSWAGGLFPFADSRNQESTSEAVNGYYGGMLWGLATNDTNIYKTLRLMMAAEIVGAQTYWHLDSNSTIYEPAFLQHSIAGIVWSSKVDYLTWFGMNVEFIHCIQMLPFTPITEALLSPVSWVQQEYKILQTALMRSNGVEEAWLGFIYLDLAILDKVAAWKLVANLTQYDSGNSRSNSLYWTATRPTRDGLCVPVIDIVL